MTGLRSRGEFQKVIAIKNSSQFPEAAIAIFSHQSFARIQPSRWRHGNFAHAKTATSRRMPALRAGDRCGLLVKPVDAEIGKRRVPQLRAVANGFLQTLGVRSCPGSPQVEREIHSTHTAFTKKGESFCQGGKIVRPDHAD